MSEYSDFLAVAKDRFSNYRDEKKMISSLLSEKQQLLTNLEGCRELMNIVGTACQEQVKSVVEKLVSEALQAVFGDNYGFELELKIVRNQPEIYMYVIRDGQKFTLKEELGGGIVDLVSFVMRIVLWSISTPRSASVMILDEPGKFISKDLQELFGEVIIELSRMLGIQFVVISHEEELIGIADISYKVVLCEGVSTVERLI